MVHIGEKIKAELERQEMPISVFARKINKSRNNVYNIFERRSIDSALLKTISDALKFDFFSLFNPIDNKIEKQNSVVANNNVEYELLKQQIQGLETEIRYLKRILELQEETIRLSKKNR